MIPTPAVLALSLLACLEPAKRPSTQRPDTRTAVASPSEIKFTASDAEHFGSQVASAGDVDGDGLGDVIVGAQGGRGIPGSARVYLSDAGGLDPTSEIALPTYLGEFADRATSYLLSAAGAGDIDGDGFDDVIVGISNSGFAGSIHVYRGGPDGVDPASEVRITAPDDDSGRSAAGAGDVNGDGYDDVVVSASNVDAALSIYLGGAEGLDLASEIRIPIPEPLEGEYAFRRVASAGDVDGDGYDDVITSAREAQGGRGAAYVYRGSAGGLDPASVLRLTASDGEALDRFGFSVAGAGDLNGDGFDEVIVGALDAKGGGAAYVYQGGPDGLDPASEMKLVGSDRAEGDLFGISVARAGDVDGDGYDDVVVGASGHSDGAGLVYVYRGGHGGLDPASETRLAASDRLRGDGFGAAVAGPGDLDGDGQDDLIVGAPGADATYVLGACTALGYPDGDRDGYGASSSAEALCTLPEGYVSIGGDCDDADPSVRGGTTERCDGIDNDCDGVVDDEPSDGAVWYADADSDGFINPDDEVLACSQPDGYASDAERIDCDDLDPNAFPGAPEFDSDGVDQDCDGADFSSAEPPDSEPFGLSLGCATAPQGAAAALWPGLGLLALGLHRRRPAARSDVRGRTLRSPRGDQQRSAR